MATLHVTDSVVIAQNPALVWNALIDFDSYAKWWPQSVRIRVLKATPELIGSQFEVRPFGGKGFLCEVESVEPGLELQLQYLEGTYIGTGVWSIEPLEQGCRVSYAVDLEIVDWFIRALSHVVNITAIHSRLVRRIFAGLGLHVRQRGGKRG
jgi:uncharacterized protein YndB with AHSA1/START domain